MAGQRPSTQEGRSNRWLDDASAISMWNLLQFLADQQPSTQGDRLLDSARELARASDTLISPGDLEIVRERITLTAEIKARLESKRGLPRYLQAREYRKSAKETFKFVKLVSDRARDATFGLGQSSAVAVPHPTSGQHPRGFLAVPLQVTVQNPIPNDDFGASTEATRLRTRLCDEMKPRLATLVETMYHFKTSQAHASISYNAGRAQELLRNLNFIYPEPRTGRDLYRHPIIQRAIDATWFRNKDDVGVVNHEQFSPMPISIIAITLTVIECCIDEWSDGTQRDYNWDDAKFQTVYDSHLSLLVDFQAHRPTSLYQLQCDLSRNAREHAGVPPDPVDFPRHPRGL
ncbi:hypothetical protein EDB84DRAFT_151634 [Lactarius hengduanensis]|nr:hypothetical protein EDB84DRAFT_151634 [Lactarius hengduanensis]